MAIFRVNKSKDYTVMCNYHLRDKSISLKAKGLLSQMLSLPDEWDYSIEGLVSMNIEEKTAIISALKELKKAGYVNIVERRSPKSGRYEYIYDIYEMPYTDLPNTENPNTENQPQLNTNNKILNNKILSNKILNKSIVGGSGRFTPPTLEEVTAYCEERKNDIDPEAFIDHYTGNGWKVGKNPMKDWRAAVRQWERNDIRTGRKPKQQQFANKSFDTSDLEALFASDLEILVKDGEGNGV